LTHSGRFAHISGHPSATGRAQDRQSTPAKDRRSTTEPRNQPSHATNRTVLLHITVVLLTTSDAALPETQRDTKQVFNVIWQKAASPSCHARGSLFPWRASGPPSNTWFFSTHVNQLHPNGISIGSAVFAQLSRMPNQHTHTHTHRQTDHATRDNCSNRPHLCTYRPMALYVSCFSYYYYDY